jgi:hypothetical protein
MAHTLSSGPDLAGSTHTLLAEAREQASALLRELPEDVLGGISVVASPTEGRPYRPLPELSSDHDALASAIEAVAITYDATDLAGALREARVLLAGRPGEVFVFTDEAGPGTVLEAEGEIRALVETGSVVIPRVIRPRNATNLVPVAAAYGDGVEGGSLRVSVAGFVDQETETALTATLPDGSEMTAFVKVPPCVTPGEEGPAPGACGLAEALFTVPPEVPGGVARVRLEDPSLPLDDSRYFRLPRVGASRVLVVDGEPGPTPIRSEVYFLERALAPWGALRGGVTPEVTAPRGVLDLDLSAYRVIFLANVGDPRPLAEALADFVRQGGGLVIASGDNVTPERYNAALSPLLPAPIRKIRNLVDLSEAGGVPLKPPVADVPLFRSFSGAARTGFGRMFQRRAVTFEPYEDGEELRTLLRFENDLPFLVERRFGRGSVLFLTGTVDLAWGNLPLQALFTPFVQRLTGSLGGESGVGVEVFEGVVGQPLSLPLPGGSFTPDVIGPDEQRLPSSVVDGHLRLLPRRPGPHAIVVPGAPPLARIAVNAPLAESDIRRFESLAETRERVDPGSTRRTLTLGPWAALLALACFLAQSLLARMPPESPRSAET